MSIKKYLPVLLVCIGSLSVKLNAQSQKSQKCLTDVLLQNRSLSDPSFNIKQNTMNQLIASYKRLAKKQTQTLSIPVVVHVVHQGGPENIPAQQIIDGIAHLNAAFANAGAYNHPDGVNTNIQFCLAQRDPAGNFTTGITRTVSNLTVLSAESQDLSLKNLIIWDPNLYLNIWLVKEINSISLGPAMAGYATFPSSHGQLWDGIVNEADLFGSTIDNSKVHIHEAGHYLGLYHTFEGGCVNSDCQADGDKVCDTPPDNSTAPVACNASVNTCTSDDDDISLNNPFRPVALGGMGDQPDMFKNYMDYGYQACQAYFTNGQSTRMNAGLSTSRQSLLSSNGCVSACTIPITLNISANDSTVDIGTSVQFNSTTVNANTLNWTINNSSVSSAGSFNHLFNTPGTYTVVLTGSNTDASCVKTSTLFIKVNCTSHASFQLTTPAPFLPGVAINASNTSVNATTSQWVVDGQPAATTTNWSQIFNSVGGHSIYLITGNGLCNDTSATSFFQVGNCNISGLTNNWVYNGEHTNFNSGNPANIGSSPTFTSGAESSSTISDRNGNLLFFSNGLNCWNRNKQVMPNGSGLLGHYSSTQGVLITPHPGNPNQYYLFTNDAIENSFANGLRYSIVDMTLNGGLGDIIPATKNTLLLLGGSEKLSATWHENGHDIWLGTAATHINEHYAFLIDNAGIHPQAVISNIGSDIQTPIGPMVFSQDGNRMAAFLLCAWPWKILVADFNKSTGKYSHPIELVLSDQFNQQVFSLLFSPDNSKLYASLIQGSDILQYDLSQTTAAQIMASQTAIDPYTSTNLGHLALGKNGKIYVHAFQGSYLDVINNPNLAGAACNYQQNGVNINTQGSALCLPNMLQGYSSAFNPSIAGPKDICVGQTVNTYGIFLESSTDVAVWSHTGPGTFTTQAGTNNAILTSASTAGTDTIRVKITGTCGTSYDTLIVHTNNPEMSLLADTTYMCDTVQLQPGTNFLSYEWQDVSNYPTYEVVNPGKYWVKMKGASGCLITDTTRVLTYPVSPAVNLGNDITLCQGQIAVLQTNHPYAHYQWQDGSINPTYSAYLPGYYTVTVTTVCGDTSTDEVQVISTQLNLNLNYNGSNDLCQTDLPFTVTAPAGFSNYLWNTGASTQTLNITTVGTYELKATDAQGCYSTDTIRVKICTVNGLNELDKSGIYCFPNPANDQITLTSLTGLKSDNVTIYSSLGALVYTSKWKGLSLEIPTKELADGIYFIRTGQYTIKLLINH